MLSQNVLIVVIVISAAAFATPIKRDAVVPETQLAEVGSVCSFSLCPVNSPGAGKTCMPKPEDCKKNAHCELARCTDATAEQHAGSAAYVAGIQGKCWTLHSSGSQCYFDKNRYDCATCVAGGCQCWEGSAAGHNRCVKCAEKFHPANGCKAQVPMPEKCPPDLPYSFTMHQGKTCRSHDANLLDDFAGTVEGCKAKCVDLKCAGFTYTAAAQSGAQGSQPYGTCVFRQGPLEPTTGSEGTDCYVPNLK